VWLVTVVTNPKGNNNLGVPRILRRRSRSRGKNFKRGSDPSQGGPLFPVAEEPYEGEEPCKGEAQARAIEKGNPEEVEGQESCCRSEWVKPFRERSAPKREKAPGSTELQDGSPLARGKGPYRGKTADYVNRRG